MLASAVKRAVEPPNMEDASCSHRRMDRPEPSRPPRKRNWRRLATNAAAEKQPKARAVPTKAVTRILQP